jgi:hypothetical protein
LLAVPLVEAEKSSMLAMRCDLDHGCTVEVQPAFVERALTVYNHFS